MTFNIDEGNTNCRLAKPGEVSLILNKYRSKESSFKEERKKSQTKLSDDFAEWEQISITEIEAEGFDDPFKEKWKMVEK